MSDERRGDIQGMRAMAVLTVIAAHAGVGVLPGGYVGVDAFYVISGYLIAGLLFRDVLRVGSFSLTEFWSRRARRILPAATLVTTVTVVASLLWLSLIETRQVVTDAVWATLFAANVHFAHQGVDYFDHDIGPSPLQHYWSLAVEEQFYLVWPLLLLACLALTRLVSGRGKRQRLPRRPVALMLVAVSAASLVWSVHLTSVAPTSAYFSTLTRAWELGVGAILALVPAATVRRLPRVAAQVLAVAGLGALAYSCVAYTSATEFPGYAAVLPVLGTAALLLAGSAAARPWTHRLLDNAPMRLVGDWSYSLYLWHWPALILATRYLDRSLTVAERVAVVAAVFALSGLTYRFVETPFRRGRVASTLRVRRALVLYPASLVLVGSACAGSWYWTGYLGGEHGDNPAIAVDPTLSDNVEALVRASVDAAREDRAIPSDLTPDLLDLRNSIADVGDCDYSNDDVRRLCPRGDPNGDRTLVLTGDSHARAWIPAFDKIATANGWRAYYLVKPQCTAAHVTVAPVDSDEPFIGCDEFHAWVLDQVELLHPDLTVVASSPPVNGVYDTDGSRYEQMTQLAPLLSGGYDDLFLDLVNASDRVALMRDVPKSPDDPGTCLTSGHPSLNACMFRPQERSRYLGDIAVQSAELAGVEIVDPTPWLCYQDECPVVIGGTLSYRDTDHITTEYAARLADELGRALHMTS